MSADPFAQWRQNISTEQPQKTNSASPDAFSKWKQNTSAQKQEPNFWQKAVKFALSPETALGIEAPHEFKKAGLASIAAAPRGLASVTENVSQMISDDYLGGVKIPKRGPTLGDIFSFLPNYEEAKGYVNKLFGESEEESPVAERLGQFAGPGSLAGPYGAIAGTALGGIDYAMEQMGYTPLQRFVVESMVLPVGSSKAPIAKPIKSPAELAFRVLQPRQGNVNAPALDALKALGIENVPVQAYTQGGLFNTIEGMIENSPFGERNFKDITNNFSNEMVNRVEGVIDAIPLEKDQKPITNIKELGEPTFSNTLPAVIDAQVPAMQMTKREMGQVGKNFLTNLDESLRADAKALYDEVQLTNKDVFKPEGSDYKILPEAVKVSRKTLQSKGFKGAGRREALSILSDIEELFRPVEKATGKLDDKGKPILEKKPPDIKVSDLKKNLQDLNGIINYEAPELINLIEPVASAMRKMLANYAEENPNFAPFAEANELFARRAQAFNDPTVKRLLKGTDESFWNTVQKPSGLEAVKKIADEFGDTNAYERLRGNVLHEAIRPVLQAKTPAEMAAAITDSRMAKLKEILPAFPEFKDLPKALENAKAQALKFENPKTKAQSVIRQEILEASMLDTTPEKTLKLMRTPGGLKTVRDTLDGSKGGKAVLQGLERKTMENILYKNGQKVDLDLTSMQHLLDNPLDNKVIEMISGKKNFEKLENIVKVAKAYESGKLNASQVKKYFTHVAGSSAFLGLYLEPITAGTTGLTVYGISKALQSKNFRQGLMKELQRKTPEAIKAKTPPKLP